MSIIFSPSPHIHTRRSTDGIMRDVLVALLPAMAASVPLLRAAGTGRLGGVVPHLRGRGGAVTRSCFAARRPSPTARRSLPAYSLALNLPSSLPLWMVAAGAVMAIGIAKIGGLGQYHLQPGARGASVPADIVPGGHDSGLVPLRPTVFRAPRCCRSTRAARPTPRRPTFSAMLTRRHGRLDGRGPAPRPYPRFRLPAVAQGDKSIIPVCVVAGLAVVDLLAGYPVLTDVLSGGLLLKAVFMATDYVTSPAPRGMAIYGVLIGVITAVIRRWGVYPEGMSFAILIMNGAVPLINRYVRPERFSPKRKEVAA